jgi:hypothetical protein
MGASGDQDYALLVRDLQIETADQNQYASELQREIRGMMKTIEEDLRPGIDAAHAAWKTSLANLQKHLEPLKKADEVIKVKVRDYLEREQRKAEAERRRLLAEAETKARAEREARAQAAIAAAQAAQEEHDEVTAAMAMDEAVQIEAEVIVPIIDLSSAKVAKAAGQSVRTDWDFEVSDFAKLPDNYKIADDKKIRGVVKAMKGAVEIPGVRIYSKQIVSQRM